MLWNLVLGAWNFSVPYPLRASVSRWLNSDNLETKNPLASQRGWENLIWLISDGEDRLKEHQARFPFHLHRLMFW